MTNHIQQTPFKNLDNIIELLCNQINDVHNVNRKQLSVCVTMYRVSLNVIQQHCRVTIF